ncbi:ribonuclease H-like domain-containing protein [Tanacetum coccineum]
MEFIRNGRNLSVLIPIKLLFFYYQWLSESGYFEFCGLIAVVSLTNLAQLPESNAILVLDQFMLSGAEERDKGAYLTSLISKALPGGQTRIRSTTFGRRLLGNLLMSLDPRSLGLRNFPAVPDNGNVNADEMSVALTYPNDNNLLKESMVNSNDHPQPPVSISSVKDFPVLTAIGTDMALIVVISCTANGVNTFSSGPHANNRRTRGNAQGPPLEYTYMGNCDQICRHCGLKRGPECTSGMKRGPECTRGSMFFKANAYMPYEIGLQVTGMLILPLHKRLRCGDTVSVVPVTATRFSLSCLNLTVNTEWYPWCSDSDYDSKIERAIAKKAVEYFQKMLHDQDVVCSHPAYLILYLNYYLHATLTMTDIAYLEKKLMDQSHGVDAKSRNPFDFPSDTDLDPSNNATCSVHYVLPNHNMSTPGFLKVRPYHMRLIRGMHTLIRDAQTTKHDFVFYADRLIRLVVTPTGKPRMILLHFCLHYLIDVAHDQGFQKLIIEFLISSYELQAKHGERIFYGIDGINEGNDIYVEGEIDKLSMKQAGIPNCVSVPDGAPYKVSTKFKGSFPASTYVSEEWPTALVEVILMLGFRSLLLGTQLTPSIFQLRQLGGHGNGKSYPEKLLRDIEVENGGGAPRIHSMDENFMTEVEKTKAVSGTFKNGQGIADEVLGASLLKCHCEEPSESTETVVAYFSSPTPAHQFTFRLGVLGAAPCVLPSAFSTMANRDPTWNMDTVKDFLTRHILLRCDSSGDLYPVTSPSSTPHALPPVSPSGTNASGIPGKSSNSIVSRSFEIVHSDIWTSPIVSSGGFKYYVLFLDHYSHYF